MKPAIAMDTRVNPETATLILDPGATQSLLLDDLISSGVIPIEAWQGLDEHTQRRFTHAANEDELLAHLLEMNLLTRFQVKHVRSTGTAHLVLGNYRILEEIGSGGMGIVYRGEHVLLRRSAAIKILRTPAEAETILLQRFFVEMRALARIRQRGT